WSRYRSASMTLTRLRSCALALRRTTPSGNSGALPGDLVAVQRIGGLGPDGTLMVIGVTFDSIKETNRGNYDDGKTSLSPIYTRECNSKSAARRRWLEHSRSWEGSSGLRDRFTMAEPLGVHQWAGRNQCVSFS